ncbi:hypothetical protein M407DRAFT_26466 [Tulasnella calospora MUT 4182]|uniref:Tetratricopeptide repeat protein 29 n=1 Tax=Tulasnella calospora MUT 4182 TaxID=1051891 RepID=A0A0C3KRN3_9AGAM|nr:hypothetical protein M407DRAFT_26466 [Tulasnella calospora MUT 4182]
MRFSIAPRCTPAPPNADYQTQSAALLENLGDLESWKENPEKSSAYLDEALRLYQEEADTNGLANVLRRQAAAAYRDSDFDQTVSTATAALEHFRDLNDPLGIADASFWLGSSLLMQDHRDTALPILHEALEMYRTHGKDVGAALCLERIGALKRMEDQLDDALSTLEEAVAVASRSGDRLGMARALRTMGSVYLDKGDSSKAPEAFSNASPIARNIGWYGGLSDVLAVTGRMKMDSGNYRECFQKQSKFEEAASALREAWLVFQELSLPGRSIQVASTLLELKSSQGDSGGALFWHDHIIAVSRSQKDHWNAAYHLGLKAQILVKAQRSDEATLHFEAAIVTCEENGIDWGWERTQLCAIPKTVMKWERRLLLLCDLKKLQRRHPQLRTATLKLPISINSGAP